MLSSGKYWQDVPRDYWGNLDYRQWVLEAVKEDPKNEAAFRRMAAEDLLWYVNVCVWTFDPELEEKVQPWITWPAQEEAFQEILHCVEDRKDLWIEKARRQGGSWMCLLSFDWLWRFKSLNQFLLISRNAMMVDSASPDSLFWKLDHLDKYLPRFARVKTSRTKMHRENLDNGSIMTGQATTAKAGVGGRATAMLVDEFSRIREDQELLDSTADTSNCRVFNSTHTGPGTAFFRQLQRQNVRKLHLHWSQNPHCNQGLYRYDPDKNRIETLDHFAHPPDFDFVMEAKPTGGPFPGIRSPWYDNQCERRGNARAIAMDLDIDARGSTSLFYDAYEISTLVRHYAVPAIWQGDIAHSDQGKPLHLVPAEGGPLRLWFNPKPDGTVPRALYGAGADISAGTGATLSCLAIVSAAAGAHGGEKVAEYCNPYISPKDFASVCAALCWLFHEALFCWEMAGPGIPFADKLLDLGYRNLYKKTDEMPFTLNKVISDRPGWYPSTDATRALLEEHRTALHLRHLIDHSEESLKECLSFEYSAKGTIEHARLDSDDDPSGARENHGDRVIATGLAWKMVKKLGYDPTQADRTKKEAQRLNLLSLAGRRAAYDEQRRLQESY